MNFAITLTELDSRGRADLDTCKTAESLTAACDAKLENNELIAKVHGMNSLDADTASRVVSIVASKGLMLAQGKQQHNADTCCRDQKVEHSLPCSSSCCSTA